MKLKKTIIHGMKLFQVDTGYHKDEETQLLIKDALEKKPIKDWVKEVKQNKSSLLVENEDGNVFQATTFTHNKILYAGIAPNLIQAYYDLAYEQIQFTDKYVQTFKFVASRKFDPIKFVEPSIFNRFIQYRISAIIFIHLTMEAFLNHIIPEDFTFKRENQSNSNKFQEQITTYSKNDIERWFSFKEKIEEVIPSLPNTEIDLQKNQTIIGRILELERIRNEVIHLKSIKNETRFAYIKIFEFIGSRDLNNYLFAVKKLINIMEKDFIKTKNISEVNTTELNINKPEFLHFGIYFQIIKIKEKRITVNIKKWKGLHEKSDHLLEVFSILKLLIDMDFIDDYLINEESSKFVLEIFKTDEHLK